MRRVVDGHIYDAITRCLRKMPEERFWEIYFVMVKDHLSPKALDFVVMEGAASGEDGVGGVLVWG
jgi:hypothetical protein